MKVALYAGMFQENQDGATKTLFRLIHSMQKHRFQVGVWTFSPLPTDGDGLRIHRLFAIPIHSDPVYKFALPSPRLRKSLDRFQPDIIHITVPDLIGIRMMQYGTRRDIPVIMSFHTNLPAYLKSLKIGCTYQLFWRILRWFYNRSQAVFAPTNEIARLLQSKGIRNVKIWSRGIDKAAFNPSFRSEALRRQWNAGGKKVILYSGRLVGYKDLDIFAEVYRLFQQNHPGRALFVLAGDGPLRSRLQKRMPDALFLGYLKGKELSEAYASADILLFPSVTETFGNVVLEALASGVPAVVSNVGGCQEIVRNADAGLVAKAGDAASFLAALLQLTGNDPLYARMRENGLRFARSIDWEEVNNVMIAEYLSHANKKNPGA